jgi:hypothetical protein
MSEQELRTIADTPNYTLSFTEDGDAIVLKWKHVAGLSAGDFRAGIDRFAHQCRARRATRAVIDAAQLDQSSPAIGWLRGQDVQGEREDYISWWVREIVPLYNDAGIASLTVGTGDPGAPGELNELPPSVRFRVAYLPDLESALNWRGP